MFRKGDPETGIPFRHNIQGDQRQGISGNSEIQEIRENRTFKRKSGNFIMNQGNNLGILF